jgi:hypothetical protein
MKRGSPDTSPTDGCGPGVVAATADILQELGVTLHSRVEAQRNLTPQVLAELRDRTARVRQTIEAFPSLATATPSGSEVDAFFDAVEGWLVVVGVVDLALLDIYDPALVTTIGYVHGGDTNLAEAFTNMAEDPDNPVSHVYQRLMKETDHAPSARWESRSPQAQRLVSAFETVTGAEKWRYQFRRGATDRPKFLHDFTRLLIAMETQLADFVRANWSPRSAAAAAHPRLVVNAEVMNMGDKYTITGSNIVGAVGPGATTGSVTVTTQTPTQEQHRKAVVDTQTALVRDQDALDKLDSRMFEALNQFLRLARDIQVEQKSLGEVQAQVKATLDDVWAEQAAKGMKPQLLPKALEVAGAIATNPIMAEVAKKLIGG